MYLTWMPVVDGGISNILYRYGSTYYINMTNRCPCKCVFYVKNSTLKLGDVNCLWLEREPTVDEVIAKLRSTDLSRSRRVVFCGHEKPTDRFETLKECVRRIHRVRKAGKAGH